MGLPRGDKENSLAPCFFLQGECGCGGFGPFSILNFRAIVAVWGLRTGRDNDPCRLHGAEATVRALEKRAYATA